MEETSKILNLCPHLCGRDEKEQVTLFSAADIEVFFLTQHSLPEKKNRHEWEKREKRSIFF